MSLTSVHISAMGGRGAALERDWGEDSDGEHCDALITVILLEKLKNKLMPL